MFTLISRNATTTRIDCHNEKDIIDYLHDFKIVVYKISKESDFS
jgi:hypothetical protein